MIVEVLFGCLELWSFSASCHYEALREAFRRPARSLYHVRRGAGCPWCNQQWQQSFNRAIGRLQSGNHPPLAIAIARNRPPACNRLHKFPAQIVLSVSDLKLPAFCPYPPA